MNLTIYYKDSEKPRKIKSRVLDKRERVLCEHCKDRYCPTYECAIVDKAQLLTYKQWDNVAKIVKKEDAFIELPSEVMKRRTKKHDQH